MTRPAPRTSAPYRLGVRLAAVAAALVLVVGACSNDTSVGSGDLAEGVGAGGTTRLGAADHDTGDAPADGDPDLTTAPDPGPGGPGPTDPPPSSAPDPTDPPVSSTSTSVTPTTTAPSTTAPSTTTTTVAAARFDIAIVADGGVDQFQPRLARVFSGTVVRWTNTDGVERSVVASDGSFASGPIAPGSTFEHRFDAVGTVNYADGTRPYAQGTIEVVPR